MFFFCLALFLVGSWCSPWWIMALSGLVLGWWQPRPWKGGWSAATAAAVAWASLAYVEDGRNYGLVSRRLSGLFNLPMPFLMYAVMGLLAFITVFLCVRSGMVLRSVIRPKS